jgi:flagellar export protein FliJ
MKAYKFRFENVLKSKRIIVDQLATKTARARKIQLLEERKHDGLKDLRVQCIRHLGDMQTGAIDAAEVRRCHEYLGLLGDAIAEQENIVKEIAARVNMLRGMLTEAEKERKIFEMLDEQDQEAFYNEFVKTERAALDEVGVNRFIQRSAYERFRSSAQQ